MYVLNEGVWEGMHNLEVSDARQISFDGLVLELLLAEAYATNWQSMDSEVGNCWKPVSMQKM